MVAALSVLLIVFSVAISLQYWTSLTRSTYFLSEADFQAELALENQIASDLLHLRGIEQKPSLPSDVSLKKSDGYDTDPRKGASADIHKHVPDPAFHKPEKATPEGTGQQIFSQYQPTSLRPEFRVFGKRKDTVVYTSGFPFAAYAPKGSISLEECFPGGNPPKGKIEGKPEDFRSGIPAFLGAQSRIKVTGEFPYGEVYVQAKGKESVALAKTTGVLVHYGKLPFADSAPKPAYAGQLNSELESAYRQLASVAKSGDKTGFILGKAMLSAKGLVTCLLSLGDVSLSDVAAAFVTPSLNQSMAFPLPAIPTFSIGVLYNELTFHLPFPPDQGLYAPIQKKADELSQLAGAKLNELGAPLRQAQVKLRELRAEMDKKVNEEVNKAVQQAQQPLNQAQQQLSNLQSGLSQVQQRYQNAVNKLNQAPADTVLQAAVKAAQADLDSANAAIQQAQAQVAAAQSTLNKAGDEARAKIQSVYQPQIDALDAQLNELAQQAQAYVDQARAFAEEAGNTIANSLPGDPKGLKTRAEEAVAAIDETLGAPGFNYIALGLLYGKSQVNFAQRALEQAVFKVALRFINFMAPGGKLTVNVQTPGDFVKIAFSFQIPTLLLDPDALEAIYRLRNLSIKEALLEYLKPVLDSIPQNEVRLVNFGDPDNPTEETFEFDNSGEGTQAKGFKSECTWDVPQGRTLALRGDVTIKGDLWLQSGSCMHVQGNLIMQRPPARSFRGIDNPLAPAGRIFLEPGATLLVDKNLNVEGGTPLLGSVVAEAPLGQASSLTSAILCQGNVNLRYGVHPGINVDHLFDYIADISKNSELKQIHDKVLTPLLTQLAPNAAKIFGPFHIRKPYIAQFATTLSLYFIIPGPGPAYPNIMVKVYRVLAAVYGVSMNASLGENLYTHCDWWLFGDGVVPIVPRVDAERLADSLKSMRFPIPTTTDVTTFFQSRLQNFVEKVVSKIIADAVSTCLGEVIKALTSVLQIGKQITIGVGAVVDGILAQFKTSIQDLIEELEKEFELTAQEAVKELVEKPLRKILDDLIRQVETSVEKSVLRDAPGALIYAGGTLTIGSASESPPLAIGMFVAKGDVTIHAKRCVGSIVSTAGNIQAQRLIFIPYFTSASLYLPKDDPDWATPAWPAATANCDYGQAHNSKRSIEVGPSVYHVTSSGWTQ